MAFLESYRLEECVARGAIGGPGFFTDVTQVHGGQEYRNRSREQELGRWEVGFNARRPEIYKPLQAAFRVAAGRFNGFRFKDYSDFEVTAEEGRFLLLASDSSGATYQLVKRYTVGAFTHDRVIQKPVATLTITGGTGVSVDYATGIVSVASGVPTAWSGEFDVPVRFGTDEMRILSRERASDGTLLIDWGDVPLIEIRIPG